MNHGGKGSRIRLEGCVQRKRRNRGTRLLHLGNRHPFKTAKASGSFFFFVIMLKFLCLSETPSEQKLIFLERSLLACGSHLLEPSRCSITPKHRCTNEAVSGRPHGAYPGSQFFPGNCSHLLLLPLPFSPGPSPFGSLPSFLSLSRGYINTINYLFLVVYTFGNHHFFFFYEDRIFHQGPRWSD